jgi:hypothetical protein
MLLVSSIQRRLEGPGVVEVFVVFKRDCAGRFKL